MRAHAVVLKRSVTERSRKAAFCYQIGYNRSMHGYYGHGYGPFVGAPVATASQIFATLQRTIRSQDVRNLALQFNKARKAESSYGGLFGAQLDPEQNPRFPRRLVIWEGRNPRPNADIPDGSPLEPTGVFETYAPGNFESIAFPLVDANRANPNIFYALGFERVPEPMMIMLAR